MFTGIIQQVGRVTACKPNDFGAALEIDSCQWGHVPASGESIAVNGCCLTVARREPPHGLGFDVIRQTLDSTTIGRFMPGDMVNLEHAATPQTLLGGHIVQGHVDYVGKVEMSINDAAQARLGIMPPPEAMEFIVERGSIAVNGVSLTIARVHGASFEVALIPTTLQLTNLAQLSVGSYVNLETDCLTKTVVNWLRRQQFGGC
jgi:riboflavin synthase